MEDREGCCPQQPENDAGASNDPLKFESGRGSKGPAVQDPSSRKLRRGTEAALPQDLIKFSFATHSKR